MKIININLLLIVSFVFLLVGCDSKYHCPLCGETDTVFVTDTIDKDIATPVLLKYGEETNAGGSIIIAYRNDALLRETQRMTRTIESCSSCGYIVSEHYETVFYDYKNLKYSTVKYFVESIEDGKLIAVIQECIGAIIY